jgi:hypothetical protein
VGEAPGVPLEEYDSYIGPDGYFNMIFDFHAADIDVENGSEWFKQRDWNVREFRRRYLPANGPFARPAGERRLLKTTTSPARCPSLSAMRITKTGSAPGRWPRCTLCRDAVYLSGPGAGDEKFPPTIDRGI